MHDVIIIGGGAAGLTSALYTSRGNLKTLILEKELYGGQMNNTDLVENFTGVGSISGEDLSDAMYTDALSFGAEYKIAEVVDIVDHGKLDKSVKDSYGNTYKTKSIIIATGATHKKLGVKGESELENRGVSYCAICDGAFYRDKEIVVVGGGDSAIEEAIFLTRYAKKVTVVHRRDKLTAQKIIQDRALSNPKIEFQWNTVVTGILGEKTVEGISVEIEGVKSVMRTEGVFVYIGLSVQTEPFANILKLDENKAINTQLGATSVKGIFAAGDVRDTLLRQISTAVGDGALAGQLVCNYIENN